MSSSTTTDPSSGGPSGSRESGPIASRRQVVVGAGSLCLLGLGLAACSGSDSGGGSDAAPASSAAASSAGGNVSGGTKIVALSEVAVGSAVSATINGTAAIVARPKKDSVVAFNARCPHEGGKVAPDGDILKCPLHGSTFNETTGEVLSGPATTGLKEIEVVIDGDNVVTG